MSVNQAYVPPLQLTKGQPPPVAANGGLSYMSFDRDGDAGTAAATEAAFTQVAEGNEKAFADVLDNAPPGPIETKWGPGFRRYGECLEYIRANNIEAPEGGLALPLRYSAREEPSYSIVSSNALWRDPARRADAEALRRYERDIARGCLYFPHVMRDARRIEEVYPGLRPDSAECMDRLGLSLGHCESRCENFYDAAEVERVFYPEMEKLLLEFFPDATDAFVYNHDVFDKDYEGDRTEDQDNKNPGVNANYANLKPMETVRQNPFVLCAWPSFADQPYITNYRIYDDRVGETTRFTYRPHHEWYWFPHQTPTEVSMLKCYDSVTDGSVSRWSFHTACIDPTAPDDAPCRRNVVVRSFVFF
ncbi:MAG: hypothetical protein OXU63_13210 [Acidobacteriota bacterium]|nr:hypothetical protein [Acidobacteriota bacterium]